MREINADKITEETARLCQQANFDLNQDLIAALKKGEKREETERGKNIFRQLIKNAEIASSERMPLCQDTGFAVVFVEVGNRVKIKGNLQEAITRGVRRGYQEGYLRKSIVADPLTRENTNDNTPPVIHLDIVPGDSLKIIVAPKGGGSENMSRIKMLSPAAGRRGVIDFVVETVKKADANPCPPIIVGVGLGGTFEKAALLSKKALLRRLDDSHQDSEIAALEDEILHKINKLGIGPQGLGGKFTALGVKIEKFPCHIASLPVAVNINCHASRHKEIIL